MGLSGKAKPWVFLGGIVRDGNLFVVSQQFPGNHAPSVRLDVGGNNLISDPMPANPIFPVPPEDHPNTVRLIDPKVTLTKDDADKAMRLLNPHLTNLLLASQSDLRHVDCVSCHTVGSFVSLRADESPAFAKQLADSSLRFSDSGTSGTSPSIEPGTVQQGRWNVHNFGYSDTARPSVSPRTANETALSVRFANDLLARPTPP